MKVLLNGTVYGTVNGGDKDDLKELLSNVAAERYDLFISRKQMKENSVIGLVRMIERHIKIRKGEKVK